MSRAIVLSTRLGAVAGLSENIIRPSLHHFAPLIDPGRMSVSPLNSIADRMGQGHFPKLGRVIVIGGPIGEGRPHTVHREAWAHLANQPFHIVASNVE